METSHGFAVPGYMLPNFFCGILMYLASQALGFSLTVYHGYCEFLVRSVLMHDRKLFTPMISPSAP
jgi:hypothetical protein